MLLPMTPKSSAFLLALVVGCAANSASNAPPPQNSLACAEGQTGFTDVDNGLSEAVNVYAFVDQEGKFVGVARPGRTTLQMPKGAKRAYVGGHTATERPANRTATEAAVRFTYRCQ
jgi:hypothetical protein